MEMSGWQMMAHHLLFGTINGRQFVVTTFGTIKLVQNYSAKSWVTHLVHSLAEDLDKNIQWTPLGLENATLGTHGKPVLADVMITSQEGPVVIIMVQNVTKTKS